MHRAYVANQNRTRINLCMLAKLRSPPRDVKAFGFFDNRVSNLILTVKNTDSSSTDLLTIVSRLRQLLYF